MQGGRQASDREIWIYAPAVDAVALRASIAVLALPERVDAACRAAGASTVVDVLALEKDELLATKGIGPRSWQRIQRAVCRHLDAHRRPLPAGRRAGFDGLMLPRRARLVLTRLGLLRREAWLAAAPEALTTIPGLDAVTVAALHAAFATAAPGTLWPSRLLRTSLLHLGLPARLRRALASGGIRTLGDLRCADPQAVAAVHGVGAKGLRTLKTALAQRVALVPKGCTHRTSSFLDQFLSPLDPADRLVIEHVAGVRGRRRTTTHLARDLRVEIHGVERHLEQARAALLARGGRLLRRLREAVTAELAARHGVVRGADLAPTSALRKLLGPDTDPETALRLLAFLTPASLSMHGDQLLELPTGAYPRIVRELERALPTLTFPIPLCLAQVELTATGLPPLATGVLATLLQHAPTVEIVADPVHGDTLRQRSLSLAARIEEILASRPGPRQACDILFAYRDRFGTARKTRLIDALHAATAFLRVGPDEWDLRARHRDALDAAEPEARRIRDLIVAEDRVCCLVDLVDPGATGSHVYLIRDILHRDPALRSLGRGVFCSRAHRTSTHVQLLRQELRRAMGEIPLHRFLANQPETTRRIRARLLGENRLFVGSAPDRVDLITNYPLDTERLARLHDAVDTLVARAGGYARVDRIVAWLRTDDLGGSYLTPHFLADLLRRHGRFEPLAGDFVIPARSRVRTHLMHRVRLVIRAADRALSIHEILAASPDLAEFAEVLPELLRTDPLVQRRDDRYALP